MGTNLKTRLAIWLQAPTRMILTKRVSRTQWPSITREKLPKNLEIEDKVTKEEEEVAVTVIERTEDQEPNQANTTTIEDKVATEEITEEEMIEMSTEEITDVTIEMTDVTIDVTIETTEEMIDVITETTDVTTDKVEIEEMTIETMIDVITETTEEVTVVEVETETTVVVIEEETTTEAHQETMTTDKTTETKWFKIKWSLSEVNTSLCPSLWV